MFFKRPIAYRSGWAIELQTIQQAKAESWAHIEIEMVNYILKSINKIQNVIFIPILGRISSVNKSSVLEIETCETNYDILYYVISK